MTLRTTLLSVCLLLNLFAGAATCRADRVYRLIDNPASQNGHFLKGTITTTNDAPSDSSLDLAEILGWQWSISGAHTFAASSQDFLNDRSEATNVRITTESISLPIATFNNPGPALLELSRETPLTRGALRHGLFWTSFYTPGSGLHNIYAANRQQGDAVQGFWFGEATIPSSSGWVIAVAVPEPTTVALIALTLMLAPLRGSRIAATKSSR